MTVLIIPNWDMINVEPNRLCAWRGGRLGLAGEEKEKEAIFWSGAPTMVMQQW